MKQLVISNRLTNRESESFQKYLAEISQISMFTPEEEVACTIKAANGDLKAQDELVRRNLRFVVSVAKYYGTSVNRVEDLVNEGNYGLIIAAKRYDPKTKFRFISYAVWWIRKKILEHLAKDGRMIRFPNNKLNTLSKIDKKMAQMEQSLGRNVEIQELLGEMDGLKSKHIGQLGLLGSYNMDSLDREVGDDSNSTLSDMISDTTFNSPDSEMIKKGMQKEVSRIINTLNPKHRRIITAIYGLDGNTPMTLEEVGEEMECTRESIRQIKIKALELLRLRLANMTISNY